LDPRPYQQGATVLPKPSEKVFRDMIDADPFSVTVFRVKFSHNNGKPFQFPVSGSRYVWHCHMLEHEDNEMMKYFCLK
jgi:spore coat protein A